MAAILQGWKLWGPQGLVVWAGVPHWQALGLGPSSSHLCLQSVTTIACVSGSLLGAYCSESSVQRGLSLCAALPSWMGW